MFTFFFTVYKNEWEERTFWRQKNNKKWLFQKQKVTKIDDIDVIKILVSKEEPNGTKNSHKYFIGYSDNDFIRPLCVKLPQMPGYVKKVVDNVTMSFKISDKHLFKKYNQIWKKVEKLLKIEFDSCLVYGDDDKYINQKQIYMLAVWLQIFKAKKCQNKKHHARVYQ